MTEMQNTSNPSNIHSEPSTESPTLFLDRETPLDGETLVRSEPPSPTESKVPWVLEPGFFKELPELLEKVSLAAVRIRTPPTPELISNGEVAMRELGLTHATMGSLPLSPWWTTCENTPRWETREWYAQRAFEFRSKAHKLMAKSNKYPDKKAKLQRNLVWERDHRRHKRTGKDWNELNPKYDTRPPSLPWNRKDENNMAAWDNQHWTHGREDKNRRNWKFEWESKEAKERYRRYWERMAVYRAVSEVAMASAYVSALEALEAPSDQRLWGMYFG